jgi:hypothetical protein
MGPASGPDRSLRLVALLATFALLGVVAAWTASRSWESVVGYVSPYRFPDDDAPAVPRITHRVVLVVIDGLRLDRSRRMSLLNDLRIRGADFECLAAMPSFSRPARATLATGAWPETHGVTTNRRPRPLDLDNLFRAARRAFGDSCCAVGGSRVWRGLFGRDLEKAAVLEGSIEERPGHYRRLERSLQAFERESARFVAAATQARLAVLDLTVTDYAAHENGALSPEYARASLEAQRALGVLLSGTSLWTTTLVLTADHGHRDAGGHGGSEDAVLDVPLVLVGRGVRAGFSGRARQVDVAPTIAALLGLPIPAASEGRPLVEAFETSDQKVTTALERTLAQRQAFARVMLRALGSRPDSTESDVAPGSDLASLLGSIDSLDRRLDGARRSRAISERSRRAPVVAALIALASVGLFLAMRGVRWEALASAAAAGILYAAALPPALRSRGILLSLSEINREQDHAPYFVRLAVIAVLVLAISVAVPLVVLAWSRRRLVAADRALVGLGAVAGVIFASGLPAVRLYLDQGLLMTWRLGDWGRAFAGVAALAQVAVIGLCAGVAPLLAWTLRPRETGARGTSEARP